MLRRLCVLAFVAVSQIAVALVVCGLFFDRPAKAGPACPFGPGTSTECIGDINGDQAVDIADAVSLLSFLFSNGPAPAANALDVPCPACSLTTDQIAALAFLADEVRPHLEVQLADDGQGSMRRTIVLSGVNLQIVNGLGSTSTTNGTGNLIVGYNIDSVGLFDRSGSHNVAVGGPDLEFNKWGGLVTGERCSILGESAAVIGGFNNTASGSYATVTGGSDNAAMGESSSVSGGQNNEASGTASSVSGGRYNAASGSHASVSGGGHPSVSASGNNASGELSSITGGANNTASGGQSSVLGGESNTAAGPWSAIVAGEGGGTTPSANHGAILGGQGNDVSGSRAAAVGGTNGSAGGATSVTVGGSAPSTSAANEIAP